MFKQYDTKPLICILTLLQISLLEDYMSDSSLQNILSMNSIMILERF
jgi:hypothetical protein